MQHICDFLGVDDIAIGVEAPCKKQALLESARMLARSSGLPEMATLQAFVDREAMGSTGFGDGTAAPHARLPKADGTHAVFLRLATPVNFEAIDGHPVDLICAIVGPEGEATEPLIALASACRVLRNPEASVKLRQADCAQTFHAVLVEATSYR